MTPEELPVLGQILQAGSSDHVFDAFMLVGPLVLVAIAFLGRTPATVALASGYLLAFVLYVGYKGLR